MYGTKRPGNAASAGLAPQDIIVQIDPASGNVTGYLDLAGLMGPGSGRTDENDVLNGIAYNPTTGHLFVTGKRWPALFELKLDR